MNGENTANGQNAMLPVDLVFKGDEGQSKQGQVMVANLAEEGKLRQKVAIYKIAQVSLSLLLWLA